MACIRTLLFVRLSAEDDDTLYRPEVIATCLALRAAKIWNNLTNYNKHAKTIYKFRAGILQSCGGILTAQLGVVHVPFVGRGMC